MSEMHRGRDVWSWNLGQLLDAHLMLDAREAAQAAHKAHQDQQRATREASRDHRRR